MGSTVRVHSPAWGSLSVTPSTGTPTRPGHPVLWVVHRPRRCERPRDGGPARSGYRIAASERKPFMSKVIVVTGAGRGLGTDIAREALAAGHRVVATGRRPEEVEKALGGPQDNLLVTRLDVTSIEDAEAAA